MKKFIPAGMILFSLTLAGCAKQVNVKHKAQDSIKETKVEEKKDTTKDTTESTSAESTTDNKADKKDGPLSEKEYAQRVEESKKQIQEMAEWNLSNFKEITFEFAHGDSNAPEHNLFGVKGLAGDPKFKDINGYRLWGYINGDKSYEFVYDIDVNTGEILPHNGYEYFPAYDYNNRRLTRDQRMTLNGQIRQHTRNTRELIKSDNFYFLNSEYCLGQKDIAELKAKGFDKNITGEQIAQYWSDKITEGLKTIPSDK